MLNNAEKLYEAYEKEMFELKLKKERKERYFDTATFNDMQHAAIKKALDLLSWQVCDIDYTLMQYIVACEDSITFNSK